MPILLHLPLAATVDLTQPLTAQQSVTVDYPEVSRDALLGQILPKLKRTARDPYSIRDFSLCLPRGLKLKNGRPDYWTLFFSFNAKNAFGGYAGIETWFAVFRKGRLSGELYRTQLDVTAGLMGMLNRPLQRQMAACSSVPDEEIQQMLSGTPVRE